jgi:hypothetical protein
MNSSDDQYAERFNWWWRGVFVNVSGNALDSWLELNALVPARLFEEAGVPPPASPPKAKQGCGLGFLFAAMNKPKERSAFLYELKKRIDDKYEFKKSWIELTEGQRKTLEERWPDTRDRVDYEVSSSFHKESKHGFTHYLNASWNLRLNDHTLMQAFQRFIKSERLRLGIKNPKQHAGRPTRPLSWRPIELLDLQIHHVRVLNTSEHSQISKARRFLK